MKISLTKLFAQDGKSEQYKIPIESEKFSIGGEDYQVVEKHPVHLGLTHEGNRVITITGEAELTMDIPCARCLTSVNTPFHLEFDEQVDLNLSEEEREEKEEDSSFIDGDELSVDELVRNELIIQWPIRVLCKDDCKGICSRCGVNLNFQTCDCDTTGLDPRMAAIKDIFSKFKEV